LHAKAGNCYHGTGNDHGVTNAIKEEEFDEKKSAEDTRLN